LTPLAIGGALMCMVYMGGHISGGHYNPAVSLAVLLRGKMDAKDFVPYVVAQVLGGLAAFMLGWWLSGKTPGIAPAEGVDAIKAVVNEAIFTLMLALTVLNVATHKKTEGNSFYGLAIGFVIVVAATAAGGISGGAFNPAVGTGATAVNAMMDGGASTGLHNTWNDALGERGLLATIEGGARLAAHIGFPRVRA
jgi:aquaporin Z